MMSDLKKRIGIIRKMIPYAILSILSCCLVTQKEISVHAKSGYIDIQPEFFPDERFRNYVLNYLDKDSDGKLSKKECTNVEELQVGFMGIQSLKGIEYFPNLISLWCTGNNLNALSISKNKKLKVLICSDNDLSALDLAFCKRLEILDCSKNHLKVLDVSNHKKLQNINCKKNNLNNLEISKCDNLQELNCDENRLQKINLSSNRKLRYLSCSNNPIRKLNCKVLRNLRGIDCSNTKIKNIDLRNCDGKSLGKWITFHHCNRLTTVKLPVAMEEIGTLRKDGGISPASEETFFGCKSLSHISIESGNIKAVYAGCFQGVPERCTIKVPKGKAKAYKKLFQRTGNLSSKVTVYE